MNFESGRLSALKQTPAARNQFGRDVLAGLAAQPKNIPCKYLYDAKGSQLFDEICDLPEYYPTRTEWDILERHATEISAFCGPGCQLIELGSGSSAKTQLVLSRLKAPAGYVPIDIAREQLEAATRTLRRCYPKLDVQPICADYHQSVPLPEKVWAAARRLMFFPGSTVGNLEPRDVETFLTRLGEWAVPGDGLLIGVDLQKPRHFLERAYNDARGVTAEFNLNLLRRINRELGADFDLEQFRHRAIYNERECRIEMRIISTMPQQVRVLGHSFSFASGEFLVSEHSYKYSLKRFEQTASRAGLTAYRAWTDPRQWFGVILFRW